jgi:hypothetical protein
MQIILATILSDTKVQWQLTCTRFEEWIKGDLFGLNWWILLGLFLTCMLVWWKTVEKSKLREMVLYTAIIIIFIIALDELGEELTLWDYSDDLFPLFPPITAIDLSSMPLIYSLIYQHFRTWKRFILASLAMSLIFCFIGEPIFVWSGVYQMLKWKSYYGLPIYFSMALISKLIVNKIYSMSLLSENSTKT